MKKKTVIVILSIVLVIFCISFFAFRKNEKEEIQEIIVEKNISENITIKNNISKYKSSTKSIDVSIPEFQNLDISYENYINNKIYKELNDISVYEEQTKGLKEDEIGYFTYETSYDRYNCKEYISLVVNQYIHMGDGRPRIQKKCYVVNAKTNSTVMLVEIFDDKINYKNIILSEINKQASEKQIELIGGNGLSELADTQAFYIKDNKLVIYFEASEIAATAVGELEFVMPFEMIENKFVISK